MGLWLAVLACVLGQTGDVYSTWFARKHGGREMNPFLRKWVHNGEWGKVIIVKTIGVSAIIFFTWLTAEKKEKRQAIIVSALWSGIFGAAATLWNTRIIFRLMHNKKQST